MGTYPRINSLGPPGSMRYGAAAEWNTFQAALLRACFFPHVSLVVATTAVRTGKTGSVAAFHRYKAKGNPGVRGIWLVESFKWYKRAALPVCRQLFGHEAVWHGTDHTWTWGNGAQVVICTYVDLQSMQGVTAGWGSVDEVQNMGPDAHTELEQRISDSRCAPCILLTGLPVFGSWADSLAEDAGGLSYEAYQVESDRASEAGDAMPSCVLFEEIGTEVNLQNVHTAYLTRMADRLDPAEYKRRLQGMKPMPTGMVFSNWLPLPWDEHAPPVQDLQGNVIGGQGGNLIQWDYNPELRTSLNIDFGVQRAACSTTQICTRRDIEVIFAEDNLDLTSTRHMCEHLRKTYVARALWAQEPTKRPLDEIACDPAGNTSSTAENITDIKVLREYFPGVRIRYTYSRRLTRIKAGISMMQARVLSAAGKRRLLMSVELWDTGLKDRRSGKGYTKSKRGRSLALAIVRLKYGEDKDGRALSDEPLKCPVDSHCIDALRYGIINRHGTSSGGQFQAT